MGLRTIYLIAAVSLIVSCTKTSIPEAAGDSHQIVVSIADTQIDTKSTVNIVGDRAKTSFSPGDVLKVYDSNGDDAEYIYKSQTSGAGGDGFVFQKKIGEEIDTTKIVAAFYPASWCTYYHSKTRLDVEFPSEQTYVQNGTQIISAPMASFDLIDKKFVFTNLSCLLKIGIQCSTEPDAVVKIQKINVTSTSEDNFLNGTFRFSGGTIRNIGDDNTVSLVGCESAGAISTDVKTFYITLPPIFDSNLYEDKDTFTVTIVFDNGKSVPPRTFTATKDGANSITKNTILDFTDDPITINPSDLL